MTGLSRAVWLSGWLLLGSIPVRGLTPSGMPVVNQARVTWQSPLGAPLSALSNEVRTVVGAVTSLSLVKTATPEPVQAGTTLSYTLTYRNNGNSIDHNVLIQDVLPTGSELVPGSAVPAAAPTGRTLTWTLGDLAPAATGSVSFQVTVASTIADQARVRNIALISSDEEAAAPSNETFSTVTARSLGVIQFQTCASVPATHFRRGEPIGIEVTDQDQNLDPNQIETVTIDVDVLGLSARDQEHLTLIETGPNTGIFRICVPTNTLMAGPHDDGILSLGTGPGVTMQATYSDPLDAVAVSETSALVDPLGIVFDTVTGNPVAGAVVKLLDGAGTIVILPDLPGGQPQLNPVTTGADGAYAFPLVNPGTYHFAVTAPGNYEWPTVPLTVLPPGVTVGPESYGGSFILNAGDLPLIRDIPLVPTPGVLQLTKTAGRTSAEIGDVLRYTVTFTNSGINPVTGTVIDDLLPHGFTYVTGSSRLNGAGAADPVQAGRLLTWSLGTVDPGAKFSLIYKTMLGPESRNGDGKNVAVARGASGGQAVTSNRAMAKVKVEEGVFTNKGTLIGKVFIDKNGDRLQTEDEPGVANAVLYLEDGTRVVTDEFGRFTIPEVKPGTHVLRLDETSLPPQTRPVPGSNRFMGNPTSQFVDMTGGGLFKANFPLISSAPEKPVKSAAETAPAEAPATASPATELPLEKQIETMNGDLAILQPADGEVMSRNHILIRIKAANEADIVLSVNNQTIDSRKIGRKITHPLRQVVICDFISIPLEPGTANRITAQVRDAFGNLRGTREITVYTAGQTAQLTVTPAATEIPADGLTLTLVTVKLIDKDGRPVSGDRLLTVAAEPAAIVEADADTVTAGHQIPCRNGTGLFTLRSPRDQAKVEILVAGDGLTERIPVHFGPHLRKMIVVGSGDLTLGGSRSGAPHYLDELYDGQGATTKRGAVFLKGDIGHGFLLTAAYDSAKSKSEGLEDLFSQAVNNPDFTDRYPTYGDDSTLGFETQSRKKLFLRLDKGKSFGLFGDFQTDLNQTSLMAYNRTFTGLVTEINTDKVSLRAFAAKSPQTQVIDTLPGRGISGFYYLSQAAIPGSEQVTLETRDRFRPDRVIIRETMTRDRDFEIDYSLRTLLFKRPVPSHDADMNPIFIIVRYEVEAVDAQSQYTYGGRGAVRPFSWLELGATSVTEEKTEGDQRLYGTDLTLKLPAATTIKAEWAKTETFFDLDNALELASGEAHAIEFKSEPLKALTLTGYYREVDDFFNNPSAVDVSRGTRKYGAAVEYKINEATKITAEHYKEEDQINAAQYQHEAVKVERKFGKQTTANAGLLHETSENQVTSIFQSPNANPFAPAETTGGASGFSTRPTLTTRNPFTLTQDAPGDLTAITAGYETVLFSDLSLRLATRQDITGRNTNLSQAEIGLPFGARNRLYLRQEYAAFEESTEWRTALGVECEIAPKTVSYNEYRLQRDDEGSTQQKVAGLRHEIALGDKLTGNVAVEHLSTLSGRERSGEPDALAAAAGAEYKPDKNTRLYSRLEFRNATDERSVMAELGGTRKLSQEYTLLFRERFFYDDFAQFGRRITSRTLLGLAIRPAGWDRFHALGKLEYKYDQEDVRQDTEVSAYANNTNAWVGSFEGHYQATARLQLSGRYAGKLIQDEDVEAYTDLVSARLLYDVTDRLDVNLEYRFFTNHETGEMAHGGAVETGYRVWKDLWLSAGYSFDSFDSDLTGGHQGNGPYVRIRLKFDEKTAGELRDTLTGKAQP